MNRGANLDSQVSRKLKEIEDLEKRMGNWDLFGGTKSPDLPEYLKIEKEVMELANEESTPTLIMKSEGLLKLMRLKLKEASQSLAEVQNQSQIHEAEALNKILYKMDSEDIKYSIYRKIICEKKIQVYQQAYDSYNGIVESLTGLDKLKNSEEARSGKTLQINKILNSEFNQARLKAELSFNTCFKKIIDLTRKRSDENAFDNEILSLYELLRYKAEIDRNGKYS